MTTESATKRMTADELLSLDKDVHGELVRGVFCERPPGGGRHGKVGARLGIMVNAFGEPRRLGLFTMAAGIWLERDPDTVREVDVSFTSVERLPPDAPVEGYTETPPDLAVEVEDHWDRRNALHDKALMWLSHDVRLVWVVHPDTRTIDVYREDVEPVTLDADATLDGGDVLPGFTCPVRAIFEA